MKSVFIPVFFLAISLVLRFPLISKGPYHSDTLLMALKAQDILKTGQIQFLQGSGLPLTAILGAFFLWVLKIFNIQDPVFAVNVMSVVFSSLCVLLVYLILRDTLDQATALLASSLLTFHSTFLAISVFGTSHNPTNFFLLMGIYFLFQFLRQGKTYVLFLCALCLGLMGACRLQDLLMMTGPVIFLFFNGIDAELLPPSVRDKKFSSQKNFGIFFFVMTISCAVFYIPLLIRYPVNILAQQSEITLKTQVFDSFAGLFSPQLLISLRYMKISFSLAGGFVAFVGLFYLAKRFPKLASFLFLWFAVPFLSYGNLLFPNPRYLIMSFLPLIMAQGYFFSSFLKKKLIFRITVFAVFLCVLILPLKTIKPVIKFRHLNALLPDFATWVGQQTEPNAVVIEGDNILFIKHYGRRKTILTPVHLYSISKKELNAFKRKINQMLKEEIPVYITGTGLWGHNPVFHFDRFMMENFSLDLTGAHLSEDWHLGCQEHLVGYIRLYRLKRK